MSYRTRGSKSNIELVCTPAYMAAKVLNKFHNAIFQELNMCENCFNIVLMRNVYRKSSDFTDIIICSQQERNKKIYENCYKN